MKDKELMNYIKITEKMVVPEKVAAVTQFSSLLQKLPLKWQKKIAAGSSKKNSYMGFVVEPYSFFLSYEIIDLKAAAKLLPPDYRLINTSMFSGTKQRPSMIIGAFNVHTSVFWGSRVELYLIAENPKTGLVSWVIIDYETNTNSFDPGQGFKGATTSHSVITTSYRGDVIIDVEAKDLSNHFIVNANIGDGVLCPLDQKLWVEGSLAIDYGGKLRDEKSETFALVFDPGEMVQGLNIPPGKIDHDVKTICDDFINTKPYEAACFPFAQHFLTTNMPVGTEMKNAEDLKSMVSRIGASPDKMGDNF